jgi:hypothetical protein
MTIDLGAVRMALPERGKTSVRMQLSDLLHQHYIRPSPPSKNWTI